MLVDTSTNINVFKQTFFNKHQIATRRLGAKVIKIANNTPILIKRDKLSFNMKLGSFKSTFVGLVIPCLR